MILSDSAILEAIARGQIVLDPFDRSCLGSNSYDVHLSKYFLRYKSAYYSSSRGGGVLLDAREMNDFERFDVGDDGIVVTPGDFFLCSTIEYTESHAHVPFLEGKSSTGRLGVSIHETAGRGDVGFCNHWTMELSSRVCVRLYPGMPIAQLFWHEVAGPVKTSYADKVGAKYAGKNAYPMPSAMWRNFSR